MSRKSEGKGPGKDFFAIRPVRLSRTPEGLVATPITGGPHPDLLKLDEADGYLEMHPFAYRDLEPGDEVTVELRYPYTFAMHSRHISVHLRNRYPSCALSAVITTVSPV